MCTSNRLWKNELKYMKGSYVKGGAKVRDALLEDSQKGMVIDFAWTVFCQGSSAQQVQYGSNLLCQTAQLQWDESSSWESEESEPGEWMGLFVWRTVETWTWFSPGCICNSVKMGQSSVVEIVACGSDTGRRTGIFSWKLSYCVY